MSDVESTPQDPKKARRNSSAEPSTTRDSNRDTKRRRKRKKKTPIVSPTATSGPPQGRLGERSRVPLSVRNEVIGFTPAPSEADLSASVPPTIERPSRAPSSRSLSKGRESSLHTPDDNSQRQSQGMGSSPNDEECTTPTVRPLPGPSSSSLEKKLAQLEAELKYKNNLIASHQALLNQVQQAVTCQVCLDLMYKPYALAPCGHLACHSCLVNWFTAPPPDNRPALPALRRKKTCPHCRAVVRERPIEIWGVKGIAQATGKSGLLQNQLSVPVEGPDSQSANTDPWKDIFPEPGTASRRGLPWFFPTADIDDGDVHTADIAPRGEDVGMLDMEDGGIYRCLDCMHEIWDGVCSSCGRFYPGHRPEGDEDDEGDTVGWLEDQMGAEEVDVTDDPGWMGLEDGDADDSGDADDWQPFEPWRRRFHRLGGPLGFLSAILVDDEEEEVDDNLYGHEDDLQDEGYESSFIDDDDDDGGGGFADYEDGPRIYEIGNDEEDEDHGHDEPCHIVDLVSDEGNEQEESSDVTETGWV